MHSRFFPQYSEHDILNRLYSYHARMHVHLGGDTDFREFIFLTDTLDKDLRDQENAVNTAQAMAKNRR